MTNLKLEPKPKHLPNPKKPQPQVICRLQKNGLINLHIEVHNCRLQSDATKRTYWIVDHTAPMMAQLNCDGVTVRPKLILRLIARLSPKQAAKVRANKAADAVLKGQFHLW